MPISVDWFLYLWTWHQDDTQQLAKSLRNFLGEIAKPETRRKARTCSHYSEGANCQLQCAMAAYTRRRLSPQETACLDALSKSTSVA